MNYFYEKQKFTQLWIWLLIIGLFLLFAALSFLQLVMGIELSTNSGSNLSVLFTLLIPVALMLFFLVLKLEIELKATGLYYKFSPFHWNYRHIAWEDIDNMEVKKYDPIGDYLGWGIRWNLTGKGRAYNVKGNDGLQLVLKNGKRVLFGTQQPEKLKKIIERLKNNA